MSNMVLAVVVLPILAIVGVIIALNVIPPLVTALITTLQELVSAYPEPTLLGVAILMVLCIFKKS